MNFIMDLVAFTNLEKDVDYEILTLMEVGYYGEFLPNKKVKNELVFKALEQRQTNQSLVQFINEQYQVKLFETRPLNRREEMYLLTPDLIDFRLATECLFGIVRMKTGEYAGSYFLYDFSETPPELDEEYEDEIVDYRGLLLEFYVEIASPYYHNPMLEKVLYLDDFEMMLDDITLQDNQYLINRLEMAIQLKRNRKDNVIQFIK